MTIIINHLRCIKKLKTKNIGLRQAYGVEAPPKVRHFTSFSNPLRGRKESLILADIQGRISQALSKEPLRTRNLFRLPPKMEACVDPDLQMRHGGLCALSFVNPKITGD